MPTITDSAPISFAILLVSTKILPKKLSIIETAETSITRPEAVVFSILYNTSSCIFFAPVSSSSV
ncbi:hypothetical protein MCHI_003625 [Candidatus Magnetoovum chiemensis]|nr:hypothetical protein MCHI_003625 [Candidatus Magnetoovum chiemensis]